MTRTLQYYKVYNCFPSFVSTFTQNGVETPNPLPNYGSMGDHLQDYFDNRMGETPAGGVGNLVAFLGSEKSLTSIHQDSLTGMANKLSTSYGITTGTVGYALLDFRGDSWKYIVGDGIIGPSNMTNSPIYNSVKSSAVSILNHFNNQYPNIKWAYAGLPNIPQFTTFAPTAGSSFSWSPSLTNSGITNSHWDASHPTGGSAYGDVFTDWEHTPTELKTFYKNQTINRVKDILDVSGWMCPDINPTISHSTQFGRVMFPLVGKHIHTDEVVLAASTYAFSQNREFHVMPLVCTLYRSRESHVFDSMMTGSNAYFTNGTFVAGAVASGTTASVALEVLNGFTANQSDAADMVISRFTLRAGMLEPAALAGADGFIYQDQMPILIDFACTGATEQTDYRMTQAIDRARNFISNTVYGTSNTDTIPWTTVAEEVKGNISYGIMAELLTTISESIPVGDPMWGVLALENGVNTPNESVGITAYDSIFWESNSQSTEPQQFYTSSEFLATCDCPDTDRGACCKDDQCADNVPASVCAAQGGNFHKDQLCSDFTDTPGCAPFCYCCSRYGCRGFMSVSQCAALGNGAGCVSTLGRTNNLCASKQDANGPPNCCNSRAVCVRTTTGPTFQCPGGKTCIYYYLADNSCYCVRIDGDIPPDLRIPVKHIRCFTECPGPCATYEEFDSILPGCMTSVPDCLDSLEDVRTFCLLTPCPDPGLRGENVSDSCDYIIASLVGDETPSEEQQLTGFLNSLDEETRLQVIYTLTNVYGYDIIYSHSLTEKLTTVNSVTQTFRKKSIVINTLVNHMRFFPNQNLSYMNLIGNYAVGEVGGYDHNIVARIQSEFAFDRFLLPNSYT